MRVTSFFIKAAFLAVLASVCLRAGAQDVVTTPDSAQADSGGNAAASDTGAATETPKEWPSALRDDIEAAVAKVRPALVRIHVVETYYDEGREMKFEAFGSGVVITPEGHVVTNHHVAGHAKQLECTFADKEEVEATLVGTDPLTDIAVIKLNNTNGRVFPTVDFGDSAELQVGEHVMAMGSPRALSQSVTLGVVSNTAITVPEEMNYGGLELDGEDVGALVRWIAHDAEIHPGNSGGPLVNLSGEIVGINEIQMGLAGAIPGNLAKAVAEEIIATSEVVRAWLGVEVQPRLKSRRDEKGVLVAGVLTGSPAEKGGLQSGDLILAVDNKPVDVAFPEQMPEFNRVVSSLALDTPVPLEVKRGAEVLTLTVAPVRREKRQPDQYELKEWGVTVRDISTMMAKEMKRENNDGVLITSIRTGGPAGAAKPVIENGDVIVEVNGKPIKDVKTLEETTAAIVKDQKDPVPVLTAFERKTDKFVTVVKVGITELQDPGLEVKKAWLPVQTQVVTADIAELLGRPGLAGFRITHVYEGTTAAAAGLKVGDLIVAVDGEKMTANAPEHYEELPTFIRQYRVGTVAEISILRDGAEMKVPVELIRAPLLAREMKKYENEKFEFTVRNITFFDKAEEQWQDEQKGVLVDQVKPGSWAALGRLSFNDLIQSVDGVEITDVETMRAEMERIEREQPEAVVMKVLRGIHTLYIELEPKWENEIEGKEDEQA